MENPLSLTNAELNSDVFDNLVYKDELKAYAEDSQNTDKRLGSGEKVVTFVLEAEKSEDVYYGILTEDDYVFDYDPSAESDNKKVHFIIGLGDVHVK